MSLNRTVLKSALAGCLLAGLATMAGAAELRAAPSSDLLSALRNSGLSLDQPVLMQPVAYDAVDKVATYRFSVEGQPTFTRTVHMLSDPTQAPAEPPLTEAELARDALVTQELEESARLGILKGIIIGNPASGRCDLRLYDGTFLSTEVFRTNLDFNNLRAVSNSVNDRASSLRTYCNPVMVYQHREWGGSSLFVPANTVINDLAANGMNNLISSHFIICD